MDTDDEIELPCDRYSVAYCAKWSSKKHARLPKTYIGRDRGIFGLFRDKVDFPMTVQADESRGNAEADVVKRGMGDLVSTPVDEPTAEESQRGGDLGKQPDGCASGVGRLPVSRWTGRGHARKIKRVRERVQTAH